MATSSSQPPTKEQAIVLNAVDNLKLTDYVVAIADVVQPENITFASRMSNGRVCIYLSSKALVDEFVAKHSTVKINESEITVRRLMNPARRIIFSNVCPSVPNSILENLVQTVGLTAVSKISYLKASIEGKQFKHILSFRRQIYVQPNESIELPSSTVIKFDGTNYRVFLSYDDVCFRCKATGHFVSDCPNKTETCAQMDTSTTTSTPQFTGEKRPLPEEQPVQPPLDLSQRTVDNSGDQRGQKRIRPSDSTESLTPIPEMLLPAKELINNAQYPLSFDEIVDFFEKSNGEPNILGLVNKYTHDTKGALDMLYDIYPLLCHKAAKSRCKNIQKRIKKACNYLTDDPENNVSNLFETYGTPTR